MAITTGDRGKVYEVTLGAVKTTGLLTIGNFYQVAKVGATRTAIPAGANVGDFFMANATTAPGTNEELIPLTLSRVCFASGFSLSWNKEKQDATTLCNEQKTYVQGAKAEGTGSITGVFDTSSDFLHTVFGVFVQTNKQTGATFTRFDAAKPRFNLMISENEGGGKLTGEGYPAGGEYESWHYLPLIIDSIEHGADNGALLSASVNFTILGDRYPRLLMLQRAD